MNSDTGKLDITGEWQGFFNYPARLGPSTPFVANLIENGGSFSGSIIEPSTGLLVSKTIDAVVVGIRSDFQIDFTKTYLIAEPDYENPVDYVGALTANGLVISGVWSLLDLNGTFEMHRDKLSEAEVKVERLEAAPIFWN